MCGFRGELNKKEHRMKKYLVTAFATPALAEQFYVTYNGKRCEMMGHKPPEHLNVLGTFNSRHDAEQAMHNMKQCQ
jgi:hypothetical protein